MDWPFKDVKKQDCVHVDHNQLDDPLPLKSHTPMILKLAQMVL